MSPPPQPQPVVNEPPATPRPAPETSRPSYPRLLDDAVAAVRANRFNEAAEVVDQLIKLDPGRGEGWSLRGLLAMDVYADLPAAREAYENALSRGTAVVFRVVHDHGNQQQFCVGNLRLTGSGVDFTPETGDHRFQASYAAVKEAAFNGVLGSQLAMFHIKADLTGGTKNFNLVAVRSTDQQVVNRKANAELLLRLVNERRAR